MSFPFLALWDSPLPVNDVIVLLEEPEFRTVKGTGELRKFCYGSGNIDPCYMRSIMRVLNRESGPPRTTILHELGHYYLNIGPRWLTEGIAQFLEAYAIFRFGEMDLGERLAHLESSSECAENIWQHVNPYEGEEELCDYELGEKFMLGMRAALGTEAMAAALRELYVQSLIFENPNHDSIYHAFNSNVPPGREEAFRAAYQRYYGGRILDRVLTDSPDRPPLVALYNATDGKNWANDKHWDSDAPVGAWHGVFTNAIGQVTVWSLPRMLLPAKYPPRWAFSTT